MMLTAIELGIRLDPVQVCAAPPFALGTAVRGSLPRALRPRLGADRGILPTTTPDSASSPRMRLIQPVLLLRLAPARQPEVDSPRPDVCERLVVADLRL